MCLTLQISLTVRRVYGSQDSIQIRYRTYSGTASAGVDYKEIRNGALTMDVEEVTSTIFIQVT
jgi:hypothetical protein